MTEVNIPARRPMEPFDALMYRSEDDPRARSTLLGLFILDRAPDWDRLVTSYQRITRLILPMRQRVVEPSIPVTMPMWVVDPDFDLSYHLRRVRLPAPGTMRQLLDFIEPMTLTPLDRARPLWEFTLIEGLEDGTAAWVTKVSHAVADGVGGEAIGRLSFDLERDPPTPPMPPMPPPEDLSPNELARRALLLAPITVMAQAARGAQTAARLVERAIRRPGRTISDTVAYARSLGRMFAGPPAERSPLMRQRSLRRRLEVLEVPLATLKAASKAAGGSLNDGFLAAICGGVRLYHEKLGAPVESVPMAIPISLRTANDPAGGNRWAGAQIAPPVGETDPAERIRRIGVQMAKARLEPAIGAMNLIAPVAVRLPPWLLASTFEGMSIGLDLQVSNVPGSPVPLYLCGAKILKTFPFGPVPGVAAMITVFSYAGSCLVGMNIDPAAITEPELFTECLRAGVDEVLALAPKPGRAKRPARRRATT